MCARAINDKKNNQKNRDEKIIGRYFRSDIARVLCLRVHTLFENLKTSSTQNKKNGRQFLGSLVYINLATEKYPLTATFELGNEERRESARNSDVGNRGGIRMEAFLTRDYFQYLYHGKKKRNLIRVW